MARLTAAQKLKRTILGERARFYAFRVMPDGRTVRLTPFGRRTFGVAALAWLKRRAKRLGWKIIVRRTAADLAATSRARRIAKARAEIVAVARWATSHEPAIHYRQARPYPVLSFLRRRLPLWVDCSSTASMLWRAAGLPDPNGRKWDGYGYTGTIRATVPQTSLAAARPGDLIVYGGGTGAHMVVVMQAGSDPIVWSHGQESGPRLYRHSVQVAVHGRTFTVHDLDRMV